MKWIHFLFLFFSVALWKFKTSSFFSFFSIVIVNMYFLRNYIAVISFLFCFLEWTGIRVAAQVEALSFSRSFSPSLSVCLSLPSVTHTHLFLILDPKADIRSEVVTQLKVGSPRWVNPTGSVVKDPLLQFQTACGIQCLHAGNLTFTINANSRHILSLLWRKHATLYAQSLEPSYIATKPACTGSISDSRQGIYIWSKS